MLVFWWTGKTQRLLAGTSDKHFESTRWKSTETMDIEHRKPITFLSDEGMCRPEISQRLKQCYEKVALSRTQAYSWINRNEAGADRPCESCELKRGT
jgi:hypothetical protein